MGDILIIAGLVLIVTGVVTKMIKDKKSGKTCCGDCSHCGGSCQGK